MIFVRKLFGSRKRADFTFARFKCVLEFSSKFLIAIKLMLSNEMLFIL